MLSDICIYIYTRLVDIDKYVIHLLCCLFSAYYMYVYLAEVEQRHISDNVLFVVNSSHSQLSHWMGISLIGLHSMWNEHFGISIVEMLAAGLIVIAHNSGGPKFDIINTNEGKRNGFLAETAEEYAECMRDVLDHYDRYKHVRQAAKDSSKLFSDEIFKEQMVQEFKFIIE